MKKKNNSKKVFRMSDIIKAFDTLSQAKYSKCKLDEKYIIVRAGMEMRRYVEEYQKSLEDAQKRLRPENLEELQEKSRGWDSLSNDERLEINRTFMAYEEDVRRVMNPIELKEVELEIGSLDEDAIRRLFESNQNAEWTVSQASTLWHIFS